MKIVIIGSGIAAFEAAGTARTLSPEVEIVLYSRERVRPYRRPALSRMASEEVSEVQFYIKPQAFYDENRIRLELGRTLTAFDPDVRQLKFDTGETESYDKLLLATGAHCFLPPVPGMELDGVMSLREYADLERLRARLDAGVGRVVVIGGGLLGSLWYLYVWLAVPHVAEVVACCRATSTKRRRPSCRRCWAR